MRRQARKVALDIAKVRASGKPATKADMDRWLLGLSLPPRKAKPKNTIKAARLVTEGECWDLVRAIVAERSGGLCEYCPVVGRKGSLRRQGNQGCHVFPKGKYKCVRFDLDNVFWGCPDCHMNHWHGFNPDAQDVRVDWWIGEIGESRWAALRSRAMFESGRKPVLFAVRAYLGQEASRLGLTLHKNGS